MSEQPSPTPRDALAALLEASENVAVSPSDSGAGTLRRFGEAMVQARAALADSATGPLPPDALREALVDTLGSLHVIEAHAYMIVRWIKDPNLNPVEEAETIRRFRQEAHERIVAALVASQDSPTGPLDVDALARIIREEDGDHSLGAGALAERIIARLASQSSGASDEGGDE